MARYKLLIKPSAVKEIKTLPRKERKRIVSRIRGLSPNPRPVGSEKLSGQEKYRLRQGAYRILYEINHKDLSLVIAKVGHPLQDRTLTRSS